MKFSANLGFLWSDLPMAQAIRQAHQAGFDAVECHAPGDDSAEDIAAALAETDLAMISLNAAIGARDKGEFGIAALPGRTDEARASIDAALDHADAIGCRNVHVMAGKIGDEATYIDTLAYAADEARDLGLGILIEPINHRDADEYFLCEVEQAAEVIRVVGAPNLRMTFDCYHVQIMEGDLTRRIEAHLPFIGHIQIAAAPNRGAPNGGEIAYNRLIPAIYDMGYDGFIGAEYHPDGKAEDSLEWLKAFKRAG